MKSLCSTREQICLMGSACLLLFCSLFTKSSAEDKPETKLWADYISAAETANKAQDFKTTEVLLEAALQLAEAMGPGEPRIMLTRVLLNMNYFDDEDDKHAGEVAKKFKPLDVSKFDPALLATAGTFDRLANNYYDRWKDASSQEGSENAKRAGMFLAEAERCARIELAIQGKLLKADDFSLAQTTAFYGLILSKSLRRDSNSKTVESYYEDAGKIFEFREMQGRQRERSSQHFSLMSTESVQSGHTSGDALVMWILLGRTYDELGDDHRKAGAQELAHEAYSKAGDNFERALAIMRREWPQHLNVPYWEWQLARVHNKDGQPAKAIEELRRVLRGLETPDGLRNDHLRNAATELAEVLEKTNRKKEAAEVRDKYHVKQRGSGN